MKARKVAGYTENGAICIKRRRVESYRGLDSLSRVIAVQLYQLSCKQKTAKQKITNPAGGTTTKTRVAPIVYHTGLHKSRLYKKE